MNTFKRKMMVSIGIRLWKLEELDEIRHVSKMMNEDSGFS